MTEPEPLLAMVEDLVRSVSRDDRDRLARFLQPFVAPLIDGTGRIDWPALGAPLNQGMRSVSPGETAERENARLYLTDEARVRMATVCLAAGGREVSFFLTQVPDGRYDKPLLGYHGHATSTLVRRGDATQPRTLHLHCHPTGTLDPSPQDLVTVDLMSDNENGWGIIDPTAERLYLIRAPGPPRLAGEVGPPPVEQESAPAPSRVAGHGELLKVAEHPLAEE